MYKHTKVVTMKYTKIYEQLINRANSENRMKNQGTYYENHHITPKCIGGNDDSDNLVLLTAREHFLAHWILTRIHPTEHKLIYAWNMFCMETCNGERYTSHLYKYARERYIELLKANDEWKKKMANSMSKLLWMKHVERDESIRVVEESVKDFEEIGYVRGRIIKKRMSPTAETKEKIRNGNLGNVISEEHRNKIRNQGEKRIWVNDGIDAKHINKEELQTYINTGWKRGRKTIGLIGITKDGIRKNISISELDVYVDDGWITSKDAQQSISDGKSNNFWINDGNVNKRIKPELLNEYKSKGWKRGRINFTHPFKKT